MPSGDYRLAACCACRNVFLQLRTITHMQRERDRSDRPEFVDGATVWWVDFCDSCRRAYEASLRTEEEDFDGRADAQSD